MINQLIDDVIDHVTPQIPYRMLEEVKFTEPLARSNPAREEGWNNTKLKGSMVPGYTGKSALNHLVVIKSLTSYQYILVQ